MISKNFQFLLFKIHDVNLGIDMEQIEQVETLSKVRHDENITIVEFDQKLPFLEKVRYESPKVLILNRQNEVSKTYGVVIEDPKDIVNVSIEQIKPIPKLIACSKKYHPIWGCTALDESILLLVDINRLFYNHI